MTLQEHVQNRLDEQADENPVGRILRRGIARPVARFSNMSARICTLTALSLVLLMGCTSDDAVAPSPTLACQVNNTAKLVFRNISNTNATYDLIWDGAKLYTIAPGSESDTLTTAAGVQHTMLFKFTNSSNNACNAATPTLAQCSSGWFSCTG